MPLTDKGSKILNAMEKEYGEKKGKSVFYASENKGKLHGVHKFKKLCGSLKKHGLSKNYSK
jgi:hypothetical protein